MLKLEMQSLLSVSLSPQPILDFLEIQVPHHMMELYGVKLLPFVF